jgi:hypothetical protein
MRRKGDEMDKVFNVNFVSECVSVWVLCYAVLCCAVLCSLCCAVLSREFGDGEDGSTQCGILDYID